MQTDLFQSCVADWFSRTFPAPTPAQSAAWPTIRARCDTLVAAPTGSGKTLTAFLAALDDLVVRGLAPGGLPDETAVVYVSPLKALANDIRLNFDAPLAGIRTELAALGLPDIDISTAVRTGDTPQRERQQSLRRPRLLGGSSRLRTTRTQKRRTQSAFFKNAAWLSAAESA